MFILYIAFPPVAAYMHMAIVGIRDWRANVLIFACLVSKHND